MEAQTLLKADSDSALLEKQAQGGENVEPKASLLRRGWDRFMICLNYKYPYPLLVAIAAFKFIEFNSSVGQISIIALPSNFDKLGHRWFYWYFAFLPILNITSNIITRPRRWTIPATWYKEEYRLSNSVRWCVYMANIVQFLVAIHIKDAPESLSSFIFCT